MPLSLWLTADQRILSRIEMQPANPVGKQKNVRIAITANTEEYESTKTMEYLKKTRIAGQDKCIAADQDAKERADDSP
jgi:hypothetical protein